jgi:uncharacterized protein (TIGR00255 family)
MILSMTAFARREASLAAGVLAWELRSVNSRYLEVAVRLPEELRGVEMRARELIAGRLGRGKVEAGLRMQAVAAAGAPLELDEGVLRQLLDAAAAVQRLGGSAEPLRTIDYLRWPGAVRATPLDMEGLASAALALLDEALEELVAMRTREGERLAGLIRQRLDAMRAIVSQVRAIVPETVAAHRERLKARLAEVRQELDANRLEQEIVLFATRSDVAEELDRLATHIEEVGGALERGGQVGRRLDFLMQEFNREANTLGSKAVDIRMTNAAVELKVLIEQMREQVQNIE